jgi:MFS family permease
MSDLGTSNLTIGTAVAVASFMYGLGALAGGPLGDKIGEAKTIAASLALSGLSTLAMLAAGATQSIYLFATALVSMGVWASFYHPTANSLISKTYTGKVAESMGLHGVGGTLGVVLTPTIAYAIGVTVGWPYAFITFGLLCLLLAIPFAKNSTREKNKNNKQGSIIEALKISELRVLLVLNVVIGLFMKGVELYFPTYLRDNRMIGGWWASVAFTLVLAVGVAGQWLGGRASDAVGSKKVLIATMAGVTLGLASLLLLPIYIIGIALFIVLYGLCFYAHQPALNYLTGLLSPESQRGAVYGIFFFASFGIGSLSQVMAGYIADAYGLDVSFTLLTAFALTALILSLKLPGKRESRQTSAM